jgi:hypothetical protein
MDALLLVLSWNSIMIESSKFRSFPGSSRVSFFSQEIQIPTFKKKKGRRVKEKKKEREANVCELCI